MDPDSHRRTSTSYRRSVLAAALHPFLAVVFSVTFLGGGAHADEVDTILRVKFRNHERMRAISGEYTSEITQPDGQGGKLVSRLRYRMRVEKIISKGKGGAGRDTRTVIDVLEPPGASVMVEDNEVSVRDDRGLWKKVVLGETDRKRIDEMVGKSAPMSPESRRRTHNIRIVRRNRPWFGTATTTVEFIPRVRGDEFARTEEDLTDEGLPLETRCYDGRGKLGLTTRVRKWALRSGIPVVEDSEAVTQGPLGETTMRTKVSRISVEAGDGGL